MGKYKYEERDPEAQKARNREKGGGYDTITSSRFPVWKVKEGDRCIRILPPTWKGARHYGVDCYSHGNIGADKGDYLCLRKMKKEACPLCEAMEETEDEEEKKALYIRRRTLAWVIDRDDEKAGPQLWAMPFKNFDQEVGILAENKRTGSVKLVDHPDEGFDIDFKRVGTKLNTEYKAIQIASDPSPISDNPKKQAEWLAYIEEHPLPEVLQYFDYDYIDAAFNGKVLPKKGADDDEGHPAHGREKDADEYDTKLVRRQREPEPEPEEDTRPRRQRAEEAEEAEAETRRPSRRREEPEEDAPPKRSRKTQEELDDEIPSKGGRRPKDAEAEEEIERPAKHASKVEDDDPPTRRRVARDEDDEPAPKKGAKAAPVEEEEESPREKLRRMNRRGRD